MKQIKLLLLILLVTTNGFSQSINDTIRVVIDLKQVDSRGLKVNVYPPSDLSETVLYRFPKTVPGIYEYLANHQSFIKSGQGKSEIGCNDNSFPVNSDLNNNMLSYSAKASAGSYSGVSAEDTYYLKDSVYILNWHYILGYFKNLNRPYKLEIKKNPELFGSGSLPKKILNDTTDIYIANGYKKLIHSPVLYSIPDTVSFRIDGTKFTISCAGNDSLLNSNKIKDLIYTPLTEACRKSSFKHKEYSFLYFSQYSLISPYLTGLEHPGSTLICYHPALLDNNIFISSSIHEFIHSVFAPLRIRSETQNNLDFSNPQADEFLWFYEGVTEYLTIKTLVCSGFFTPDDFLNEIEEANRHHKNINLSKVSSNVYRKKEQKLFDNFYTKGCLFAMELDIEIIEQSKGKADLFSVMQKLQKSYNPQKPFNSKTFISDLSKTSGLHLADFISARTQKKVKINCDELIGKIGYTKQFTDTTIWTYNIKGSHLISNFKENRFEIAVFRSKFNKELGYKKITICEINGLPLTWYNDKKIRTPQNGQETFFKALTKSGALDFAMKPDQATKKQITWVKNSNYESGLARKFWER